MNQDSQADSLHHKNIKTDGGTYIEGDVNTGGGDFVGRDKVVIHSRSEREELEEYLALAAARFEAKMLRAPSQHLPDQPYKFLYSYSLEDASIFFGRKAATQALYETVLKDRITVLHGRSGVGKTSLLRAGLAVRLIQEGRLPVFARAYTDPILSIKQAIAPHSLGPWPTLLSTIGLQEFLGLILSKLSNDTDELVVILDQFEEFFILYPDVSYQRSFIETLGDCYEDKTLAVRFVISLRSDYFANLADFQTRLSNILFNQFSLKPMSRTEAREAIVEPVARLDPELQYEPALVDALLDELTSGDLELPHLQIICTRLYETISSDHKTIMLETYNSIDRAQGILGGYLSEFLNSFTDPLSVTIAKEALKILVSSEATKRVLRKESLTKRINIQLQASEEVNSKLENVLDRLVEARLLQIDKEAGYIEYELAHDYLAEQVKQWLNQEEMEVKQAEELLDRELANWRVNGTLMSTDHLKVITAQVSHLDLSNEAKRLLLQSALNSNYLVDFWWPQLPDADEATRITYIALFGEDRERAMNIADTLWPEGPQVNEAFNPLVRDVEVHLDSADQQEQAFAKEIQVFIGPKPRASLKRRVQLLRLGVRLLVPRQWSTVLTLALGGAVGGLIAGLAQTFLGLLAGYVLYTGLLQMLRFLVINEPSMAMFGASIGVGLRFGTILGRGRHLGMELIGGAIGGALGGFLLIFYFIILGLLTPTTMSPVQLFLDRIVVSALLAITIIMGMRFATRWEKSEFPGKRLIIKQVAGAVLIAGLVGLARDFLINSFPGGTLLAIFMSASLVLGLSLAEQSINIKKSSQKP